MKKLFFALAMSLSLLLCSRLGLASQVQIPLASGWNLVNLPLQPQTPSIQAVLAGTAATVKSVWKWENNTWSVYLPGENPAGTYAKSKQFGELATLDAGQGFWLNCETAGQLAVTGQDPTAAALQLNAGWNLVGLKTGQPISVANLFATVKPKIISVWAWQGTTWGVALPGQGDDGVAYAASKQFGHLTEIGPLMGFWVNSSEATGAFPPAEGKVLARINGALTPVVKASVYLNNQLIATSDYNGLFHYPASNSLTVTVKADGFLDHTALLAATGVRSYFWLDPPEPEPDFTAEAVGLGKVKAKSAFKEYPNLLIMEATVAESAKPTPKEISDGTAALTITDMALTKDTTAAVVTFPKAEAIKDSAAVTALLGGGQTTHLIGGADILLSDALGNPTTSSAAGFSGKVRPTLKGTNLSDGAMTLAAMQTALAGGTGTITLLAYHDQAWHPVGKGVVSESAGVYSVRSAPGVVMDGLYPFLFIFAGKRVVTGTVESGDLPVANALITIHGSDDTAVTLADGSFAVSVPDLLPEASLTVFHESYYLGKATATFAANETSKAIGAVPLTSLTLIGVQGTLSDLQQQKALAGAEVRLRFAQIPPTMVFPLSIAAIADSAGLYTFPTVPADLLPQASVEVTTSNGYQTTLDQPLPAAVDGTVDFAISLVVPLWVHPTAGNLYATPAVDSTNLFFGTVGNQLLALDRASGQNAVPAVEVNPFGTGNRDIVASPVLVGGGLAFGSNDDGLYFYTTHDAPLEPLASVFLDSESNNITGTAAVDNGSLYFGGWNGRFYAYAASAPLVQLSQQWQFPAAGAPPLPARILSSPVVADGKVYFGGGNNLTVSLTDDAGQKTDFPFTTAGDQQTVTFSENVASSTITVTAEDKTLYCLNAATGSLEWSKALDGAVVGRPAISGQTLFIATLHGTVSALDLGTAPPVTSKWTFPTVGSVGPVYSSPVVAAGRVYFGSDDHRLYCLDATTGAKIWAMKTGDTIIAAPVVAGGRVYVVSLDGSLYCIAE